MLDRESGATERYDQNNDAGARRETRNGADSETLEERAVMAQKAGRFGEAARLFEEAAAARLSGGRRAKGRNGMIDAEAESLALESHGWYNRSLSFGESRQELRLSIYSLEMCIMARNRALALMAGSRGKTGGRDEEKGAAIRALEGNLRFAEGNLFTQRCNLEIVRSEDPGERESPGSQGQGKRETHLGRAAAFLLSAAEAKRAAAELTDSESERWNRLAGASLSTASRFSLLAEVASGQDDHAAAAAYLGRAIEDYGEAVAGFREALRHDDSVPKRENMEAVDRAMAGVRAKLEKSRREMAGAPRGKNDAVPARMGPAYSGDTGEADVERDFHEGFSIETYFSGRPVKNIDSTLLFELRNPTPFIVGRIDLSASGAFSGKLSDSMEGLPPFSERIASLVLKPDGSGQTSKSMDILVWPDSPKAQRSHAGTEIHFHGDYVGGNLVEDSVIYRSVLGGNKRE